MPHARKRHVLDLIKKRLKFARVVTLQGARQTGKSFLAREFLPKELPDALYQTFDQKLVKTFAEDNPESFLKKHSHHHPLIIDEAQKVPDIFDAVKFEVDQNSKPGQYVLLGSSEFSREAKIKETLTGRLSKIRVYPFNLSEAENLKPNPSARFDLLNSSPRVQRKAVLRYLDSGGFPGIFSVRDASERESLLRDWISVVTQRDILLFSHLNPDPELAEEIVQLIPILDRPDATSIAKKCRRDTRVIQKHLKLLEQLFVIHRVTPHPLSPGKPLYFLCDVGLSVYLGADFHRSLATWFLLEQLSQRSYRGSSDRIQYYRSAKGGMIDFIIQGAKQGDVAVKILSREKLDRREFEILYAFRDKCLAEKHLKPELIMLAPVNDVMSLDGVKVFPWESMV